MSDPHHLPWGDEEKLGALLRGLEPRLRAVAMRITRDPDSARDVVQNAFEKVLRHGAGFDGRARVSTWIHRIVVNEALMWLRAERRRAPRERDFDEADPGDLRDPRPDALENLEDQRRAAAVRKGLASLRASDREVLDCVLEGHSYEECGVAFGLHPGALKSRAFRARRRLAGLLAEA